MFKANIELRFKANIDILKMILLLFKNKCFKFEVFYHQNGPEIGSTDLLIFKISPLSL